MSLIDRYIITRFLTNFVILFLMLFIFAAAIDLLLQLDRFVEVVNLKAEDAGWFTRTIILIKVVLNFHGPRIFQFYAYMLGLLSIGAMGFTLAQMHRHKELVAVLASGVRLHRIAVPIICAVFALNLLQLINQEFILPKLAPLLIRNHGDIGKSGISSFAIPFSADSKGNLIQSPGFNAQAQTLEYPTILLRDESGRTIQRISAKEAVWDEQEEGWRFTDGQVITPSAHGKDGATSSSFMQPANEVFHTDLSPDVLTMRQHRQYAAMLSMREIGQLMESGQQEDTDILVRFWLARFTSVVVNMLLLVITLPFFLLREPANLLRQSFLCASTAIPVMLGALIGLTVDLPGIEPAVEVFLPGLVLIPIAMFQITLIRT
ncbi:MAG: LptF/LptG family permease [Planctomycetes bacterium]|nr:LptF/LptG family permease [Planctomycetota bacterium]